MKIHIDGKPIENGHVMGYVEVSDLGPALRDALRLRESGDIDALNCIIYFEIKVEDASEYHAEVVLDCVRILSPVPDVFVDVAADDVDSASLEARIHALIDWDEYWSDYQGACTDRAYETYKDQISEGD